MESSEGTCSSADDETEEEIDEVEDGVGDDEDSSFSPGKDGAVHAHNEKTAARISCRRMTLV